MYFPRILLHASLPLLATCSVTAFAQLSPDETAAIKAAVPRAASAEPRQQRRLLVLNRSEGYKHSAIPRAAAAIELMGQTTGAFEAVQTEELSALSADHLQQFDAVCFNNTTQLSIEDPALRVSLLQFVASGKGIVGIHAATDNFPTWPEGRELFGGYFDGHPWTGDGTWAVMVTDRGHPLTAAFGGSDFVIKDEIYRIRQIDLRKNCRVLLALDLRNEANLKAAGVLPSDRDLPISWVRTYGRGRLFYSSLGHNHEVYTNPAVLRHYLDGIQFALGDLPGPTDPVPFDPMSVFDPQRLEQILGHAAAYRQGDSREALLELDAFIRSVDDIPEPRATLEHRLGAFVAGTATLDGKRFVCARLGQLGGSASIPLLAGMLGDSLLGGHALVALGSIEGAGADSALLQALGRLPTAGKVGVISVLGDRRVEAAVQELEALAAGPESVVAVAAISALGRVGTPGSLAALERVAVRAQTRAALMDAKLAAADRLTGSGSVAPAMSVYRELNAEGTGEPVRAAALRGVVLGDPAAACAALTEALASKDPTYRSAAAGLLGRLGDDACLRSLARSLPRYGQDVQVQLLAAFRGSADPEVRNAVFSAMKSQRPSIRTAAMRSAGASESADAVRPLVLRAAAATGAEKKEARTILKDLHAPGADDTLLAMLHVTTGSRKAEVVRALGERNVSAGLPAVLKSARERDPDIRTEAIRSLRALAGPEQVPDLVDLLVHSGDDDERKELSTALAAAARRHPDRSVQDSTVVTAYRRTDGTDARAALLAACGAIGAPASLPVLRQALRDRDPEIRLAAVRALAGWPSGEPFPDLWEVAGGTGPFKEKTLALRGAVRLLGLDTTRAAGEKARLFTTAMAMAPNDGERKSILGAVGESRSVAGLEVAAACLPDTTLRTEAEAAVLNIVDSLAEADRRAAVEGLRRIRTTSSVETNRTRADELVRRIQMYDDHITSWTYAGPYRKRWVRLLEVPFGPEVSEPDTSAWTAFRAGTDQEKPWALEVDRNIDGKDNLAYLRTWVWSPDTKSGRLEVGSDGGMKVWLNDSLVHTANVVRVLRPAADTVTVALQSGWNRLTLKLDQGDDRWRACARFRNLEGERLEGIRVSSTRE
jgi:hypothetical protein